MKRDRYLQSLILMRVRDGKEHPELKKYSEQEQVYNGVLLIEDGYVEGHVVRNSSGFPAATSMSVLTSKGHDFLDKADSKPEPPTQKPTDSTPPVALQASLPDDIKNLLEEALGHIRIHHRQQLEEAIRVLKFALANQRIAGSSAANQQTVKTFCDYFDSFANQVWAKVKSILEMAFNQPVDGKDIVRLLDEALDTTSNGDRQWLLGLIEPERLAIITTSSFQTHCSQTKAKIETDAKIYCRSQHQNRAEHPKRSPATGLADLSPKLTRRTLTVMFTDMKGYSTLMGEDEAAALQILEQHNAVIDPCIPAHDGRLVKGTGDGYMVCFQSALDALQCAFAIQGSVSNLRHGNEPIQVRIGINTGDVFVGKDDDLYGEVVNNAKRIEAEAPPAGICVSESVRQNISVSERKQFSFQGGSEVSLKGSAEPVKCWHVTKADGSRIQPVSVQRFVPQPATRNPAIFFHDVAELTGDRSGPFKISDGAKLYLRLYPKFSVARIETELEAKNLISGARLKPLGRSTSWGADRNAFGAIIFETAADGTIQYFSQLFLSRELWGVDGTILNEDRLRKQLEQWGQPHTSPRYIAVGYVEQCLVECLDVYLAFAQAHLQLSVPLVVEGGLIGIKGYSITISDWQMSGKALRDEVSWSGHIESFEKPAWEILEGLFKRIWDNCGLQRPPKMQADLANLFETRGSQRAPHPP